MVAVDHDSDFHLSPPRVVPFALAAAAVCALSGVGILPLPVAVQLDVNVGEALIRLRAYAFGHDRPLAEVAKDIVARRLRFDRDSGEKEATS